MARLFTGSAALGHIQAEGLVDIASGTFMTFDTSTVRNTGGASYSFNTTNGVQVVSAPYGSTKNIANGYWARGYFRWTAAPNGTQWFLEHSTTNQSALSFVGIDASLIITVGTALSAGPTITTLGTAGAAVALNTWYRVELYTFVAAGAADTVTANVYLGDSLTPLFTFGPFTGLSLSDTVLDTVMFGVDGVANLTTAMFAADVAVNDSTGGAQNTWPGPGAVRALRPVANGTAGTLEANWTKPGGSTTSKWTSVVNVPPAFAADTTAAGSAELFLRNPTNASSDVTLACTDYATAGVPGTDAITLVQPVAVTGSASATATAGTIGMPSNPTISQLSFTAYATAIASTTYTTWLRQAGTVSYAPSVTLATQPQVRLNRAATALSVMTDAVAVLVESTAAAVAATPPVKNATLVGQAVQRAANW